MGLFNNYVISGERKGGIPLWMTFDCIWDGEYWGRLCHEMKIKTSLVRHKIFIKILLWERGGGIVHDSGFSIKFEVGGW